MWRPGPWDLSPTGMNSSSGRNETDGPIFISMTGRAISRNSSHPGPFTVTVYEGIDEKNRVLYFTANGREQGEDPYYLHLYRVNLDGTGLEAHQSG